MSVTQDEKAARFCTLHDGPGTFLIPNPWDVGSARILAGLGFHLTARAHNLLYAASSLDDTISRLQAYEKAGASVLFAPGLSDLAAVRAVCAAVSKPVNFMVGIKRNGTGK